MQKIKRKISIKTFKTLMQFESLKFDLKTLYLKCLMAFENVYNPFIFEKFEKFYQTFYVFYFKVFMGIINNFFSKVLRMKIKIHIQHNEKSTVSVKIMLQKVLKV